MHTGEEIVLAVVAVVTILLVLGLFVWAAVKDGQEDRHDRDDRENDLLTRVHGPELMPIAPARRREGPRPEQRPGFREASTAYVSLLRRDAYHSPARSDTQGGGTRRRGRVATASGRVAGCLRPGRPGPALPSAW